MRRLEGSFHLSCGDLLYEEDIPEDVPYFIEVEWTHDEADDSVGLPPCTDWFVTRHDEHGKSYDITYDICPRDSKFVRSLVLEAVQDELYGAHYGDI